MRPRLRLSHARILLQSRALRNTLLLAASLLASASVAAQNKAPALSPWALRELERAARCGAIDVAEDPLRPEGRRLQIAIAVVPASEARAHSDPIVVLMGGPGEDAISAAGAFAQRFSSLLRDRDLLLVDQRGTGRSGALRCELFSTEDPTVSLRDLFPAERAAQCATRLQKQADLTKYTYAHFAHDLEHVRRTLGYGRLNLSGGSYGTRAAQVYLRMYPDSVRTVFLGSVVPIDVATPLTFAPTTQRVLDDVLAACAADVECRREFPMLGEEWLAVLSRLRSGPVQVRIEGVREPARLHDGRFVEWLRGRMYRPSTAAEVPWLIHQAYLNAWSPIVDGILEQARSADSALSLGLLLAITCSEDVAFIQESEIKPATRDTYLGDFRIRQQQRACRSWPQTSLPANYRDPVRSSAPTMFVSGDMDAASPLWFTDRVAKGFPNRLEVIMRGRGHTEWNTCVEGLYERFVRSGSVQGIDASSCAAEPRPAFRTK